MKRIRVIPTLLIQQGGLVKSIRFKDHKYTGDPIEHSYLIKDGANYVGSQSIVASIDVKKTFWGKYRVFVENGTLDTGLDPVEYARRMMNHGAGELIVNSIEKDGTFSGYDLPLITAVSAAVDIPVVVSGGAATVEDFVSAVAAGASAVSAGSMFVFQRPHRAVLISYPTQKELKEKLFSR